MTARTIAIGDIHGCSAALASLLGAVDPDSADTIVLLGDYVDRGESARGVFDQLLELQSRCRLVAILGNHDELMLRARDDALAFDSWMDHGGDGALDSYGPGRRIDLVPKSHFEFLESCVPYHETDTHLFLHANYQPDIPAEHLDDHTLRWLSMREYVPAARHCSGKTVVMGHTPQPEVWDEDYFLCLDTGCCKGGWLTACDVERGTIWQTDQAGNLRERD